MNGQTSMFDFIEEGMSVIETSAKRLTFTPRQMNFKVWDTEGRQWMSHSFIAESHVLQLQRNNGRFVFVEGTGVQDKNGREVYNGDIVDVAYYQEYFSGVVRYNAQQGHYAVLDEKGKERYSLCILTCCKWSFEIVGHALETEG